MKYFVGYGCYLGMEYEIMEAESEKDLEMLDRAVYDLAREATEGWVGMHGFDLDEEDGGDEEAFNELVEGACNWYYEEYDPEKHDGYLS